MGESKSRVVETSLGCCAMDGSIRQESGSVLHGMGLLCSEFTTGSAKFGEVNEEDCDFGSFLRWEGSLWIFDGDG